MNMKAPGQVRPIVQKKSGLRSLIFRTARVSCWMFLLGNACARAEVIHEWNFNETSGTVLQDAIGSAHGQVIVLGAVDFSLTNGHLRLLGGARNSADYAAFPSGLLKGLSNVTIEAWITPRSFQTWSRAFDFGSGNGTANTFFLSLCRGASLNQQRLEFVPYTLDSALSTVAGREYHYAVTWSASGGAGGGGRLQWYRDGVWVGAIDTGATTVANVDDTVLWLGRSQYAADNTADAEWNELRLYSHALTQAELNASRTNGPDHLVIPPPVAQDDAITLNPGAMALIPVLRNDSGTLLDPGSVTIVTPPAAGTAQVKSDGKILYTHNGAPAMADRFSYTVRNRLGDTSQVATVFITVSASLRLPNTTVAIPNTPPPVVYQVVDAFPGLTFDDALALRSPPGSSNQLFVVERRGTISFVPDVTASNPVRRVFLNIANRVAFDDTAEGELGLLGMDFHPGFATNGIFFVYYTAPGGSPYFDRLSRFSANVTNLTADSNSEQILFSVVDQAFNHNGGDLHFGPDGYLYFSMGDEGDQYNFRQNAQRIDKDFYSGILRIDVDKRPGSLEPTPHSAIATNGSGQAFYGIPPDNPFVGATGFNGQPIDPNTLRAEFWAVGFRHPWRISIDPANGEVWAGDVGQDNYEEVNVVVKGGNYGWAYYEGFHPAAPLYPGQSTLLTNPPPGLVSPLWEYAHTAVPGGDPQYKGNSVTGGVVCHGNRIPQIDGAYLFGDFESANIWALRRTNSSVTVERIAGDLGVAAFGVDPGNSDVLFANYLQNKVKRLVRVDAPNSAFPSRLSDTGVFADLATLTPNPGTVSYEPIVPFWSDYALKRRWFTIPDLTNKVVFAGDTNWSLPAGMMWIKHFDLELERGNPATRRRLETRVLVRTDTGIYGVSYQWNDAQTEAFLVGDGGTNFTLTVQDGTNSINQQWEIPSRAGCLACHTAAGGHALSFNTRQMNQVANMNGVVANQIATLSQSGYFAVPVDDVRTLPAFAPAANTDYSLEYRARSYLAVNCVQCHQPGGAAPASWDARPFLTLAQTRLIHGTPENNGGDAANQLIVPGDLAHSILLQRVKGNGFSRMPPLATHQLDPAAIQLLEAWINQELPLHLTYDQWRAQNFAAGTGPETEPGADPDGDGARNYVEFLTRTDPQDVQDAWKLDISASSDVVNLTYQRVPNLGVVIETGTNLFNWTPWDFPGNEPFFGSSASAARLQAPLNAVPSSQYFRARVLEP